MLLSRLQADNKYFLGYGNRQVKQMWAGSVEDQIKEMKEIYNSLTENEK
ncbi:LPD11 domain-containing protein, partial [Acinetobacter sp. ULE_I064]